MRLTCPNCDAVYEVPRDAIPLEGRDVQCTNCGHSWFQTHPEASEARTPAAALTPDARRVLEEEAERELATRAEERGRARRPRSAPVPVPRDPDEDDLEDELDRYIGDYDDDDDEPAPQPAPPKPRARRGRELLPDIEEVDGSLKQAPERRGGRRVVDETMLDGAGEDDEGGRGRGFRLGFGLVALLALAAAAIYVFADPIAEAVPALAPAMERYVATIDGLRASLDSAAAGAAERLTGWVDSVAGAPEGGDAAEVVVEEAPAEEQAVETDLGPDVDPEVEVVVEPEE